MGEVFALEESQENSMTLALLFFPLPCFLHQKQHVVKCLHRRHWPFLLVEKGCAVLRWPAGQAPPRARAPALMASPSTQHQLGADGLSLRTGRLLCNLEHRLCSPEPSSSLPLPYSLFLLFLFIRDFSQHLSEFPRVLGRSWS